MDTTAQIDAFFAGRPEQWALFDALHSALLTRWPDMQIRVMKTCISFDNPKPWCYVSFPKKKKESGLMVCIGLRAPQPHPRIVMLTPISKARFTAHMHVKDDTQIDDELLMLIEDAIH